MLKRAKKHGHIRLYSGQHHIQPDRYRTELVVLEDCLAVVCHDVTLKKSWRQRVSVCLVSALVQDYFYNLDILWELLTQSLVFHNSGDASFSTQHIRHFASKKTSMRVDSYVIYKVSSTFVIYNYTFYKWLHC
jgi:hypothetical protein